MEWVILGMLGVWYAAALVFGVAVCRAGRDEEVSAMFRRQRERRPGARSRRDRAESPQGPRLG